MGGCELTITPTRYLTRAPQCFSLQLAWDISVSGEAIAATLAAVDEHVHLSEVGRRLGRGAGGCGLGAGRVRCTGTWPCAARPAFTLPAPGSSHSCMTHPAHLQSQPAAEWSAYPYPPAPTPPRQVYHEVPPDSACTYRLSSLVCYYGQHYQAIVWRPEQNAYMLFDDASVSRVGGWDAVKAKCQAGRIQPSVLFYQAAAQ